MVSMSPRIGGGREWIGKIFFALALLWFGGAFWILRPDLPHVEPRPTPIVDLPDGPHKVYLPYEVFGEKAGWVEKIDVKTQYTYWDFLRRPVIKFMAVAITPPLLGLIGAMGWLFISDRLRGRNYSNEV